MVIAFRATAAIRYRVKKMALERGSTVEDFLTTAVLLYLRQAEGKS